LKADDCHLFTKQDNSNPKDTFLSRHSSAGCVSVDARHSSRQVSASGQILEQSNCSRVVAHSSRLSLSHNLDLNVAASNIQSLVHDKSSLMRSLNQEMTESLSKISLNEHRNMGYPLIERRQTLLACMYRNQLYIV